MKKKIIIITFSLLLIITIGLLIWNPFEKNQFAKKIDKVTVEYVENVLKEKEVDSVVVKKVDSLTAYRYAKLTLELLNNMYYTFQEELFNEEDEHKSDIISMQLSEIEYYIDEYNEKTENSETDDTELRYYMITAFYYKNGEAIPIIFLITPDFQIFEYDIFNEPEQ